MKQLAIGILAHVDAGKTTLSECFAYQAGLIRKMGRVDHADSFFDTDSQEKERGITIFSKTAAFELGDTMVTLVDTPGHMDFSSEMERSLQVIDKAIVVISGLDGFQAHTRTIFQLLDSYQIPYVIFFNKMDIAVLSKEELLKDLRANRSDNFVDFSRHDEAWLEQLALSDDALTEDYLKGLKPTEAQIQQLIQTGKVIPVYFGSALKNEQTERVLQDLVAYQQEKNYPEEFGMKIFKIAYDQQLTRLCYVRITGGILKAKQKLSETEKVDQIRLYSSDKYTLLQQASAGSIVALKGLNGFAVGQGFGIEENSSAPLLNNVMNYRVVLPRGCDDHMMLKQLQMIQQQDPALEVSYDEQLKEIHLAIMGEIQIEVIRKIIRQRTGVEIQLDNGRVLFKETIAAPVIGIGHFEPLRHYAEVHVRIEPLERNEGLRYDSEVSTDDLAINWQRLILTHLKEKTHKGVLTGNPLTDVRLTLVAGKAHLKHTEGGDFRQATYRAVRQGLKKAQSILLEPYYHFTIQVDANSLSRILYDLDQMKAQYQVRSESETRIAVEGSAPVRLLQNYQTVIASLSSAKASIAMEPCGYRECQDAEQIIEHIGYDSEQDLRNPTGSVFCKAGAGFNVPYDEVDRYAHIQPERENESFADEHGNNYSVSNEELARVISQINGRNSKPSKAAKPAKVKEKQVPHLDKRPKYLIVDGYNMMFAWQKTKGMTHDNFDGARDLVINQLASYCGYKGIKTTVVFDAYRRDETLPRKTHAGNLEVVYSSANQTADSYIEKLVHDNIKDYAITVASSDYAVQNVIFAQGASRISSRELEIEIEMISSDWKK